MYDFGVIGSGLFGSVFAHEANLRNKKVLVIEKRNHIGGNIYTSHNNGINVHEYGPHIWHTTSKKIHNYMCQFCAFNNFTYRGKINYENKIYSFPINLMTLHQLWGVTNPKEAEEILNSKKIKIDNPKNLEDWVLSQVGEEIYEIFIKGYSTKQWGRDPKNLPASIIKRLPIRLNFNDRFYPDEHLHEGIPIGGYTPIIEKMLDKVEVKLEEDFFESQKVLEKICNKIIYTGPLDKFFNYSDGKLEYRSMRFEKQTLTGDYQGNAIINYTSKNIPFIRIVEHKHFEFTKSEKTIITREYAEEYTGANEPYYPINDEKNKLLANHYNSLADNLDKYYFGGRLATYNYYDMHQVVASALKLVSKIL
jgi:UDP-galactopyranose mutase